MATLYHLVIKDHQNSGYVWDEFFCPDCLESRVMNINHLEILHQNMTTPQYLSRLYPSMVDEPLCSQCRCMFTH